MRDLFLQFSLNHFRYRVADLVVVKHSSRFSGPVGFYSSFVIDEDRWWGATSGNAAQISARYDN